MDEKKFAIKETVSAEEVKMLRKKLGLTQRDFAGLLGCSKPVSYTHLTLPTTPYV